MTTSLKKLLLPLLLLFTIAEAEATPIKADCGVALKLPPFVSIHPVKQLLTWEQQANTKKFNKPTKPIKVYYVKAKQDDVRVNITTPSSSLTNFMSRGETIPFFRHPLNQDGSVPHAMGRTETFTFFSYSASRSMFKMVSGELYSFKLPTSNPHPYADAQVGKADLKNDSILSIRRSQHLMDLDKIHETPETLVVLKEVMSVADNETGNGFSIRDLRPLQDGHYYLPAFSIPYVGHQIAEHLGKDFESLWGSAFAAAIGKAKAELLLYYGLQMKTPNAQNWLIQLNPDMTPTGRIFMRDLADSNFVDFIAKYIDGGKSLKKDEDDSFSTTNDIDPHTHITLWQMDDGGVDESTLASWTRSHDNAYMETLKKLLGSTVSADPSIFLQSPEGIQKIQDFQRQIKKVLEQRHAS